MDEFYNEHSKYDNILNRIKKNASNNNEGFFLIIKQYLTNNICYYFIFVLIRFFPLMILTGNYIDTFLTSENELSKSKSSTDSKWLRKIFLHSLINAIKLNEILYIYISFLLLILFIIRIILYLITLNGIHNREINNKWPKPFKYIIIMDHIVFLIFPYILEFLSFIYFIIFIPDKFLIKPKKK